MNQIMMFIALRSFIMQIPSILLFGVCLAKKKVSFSRNSFRFFMAFHSVANELWLALWAAHKKARMKSAYFRIVIKFNFHACLHNFSYLLPFHCSKKKLIQQRSHQTTDRPIIPNILMMPTSKTVEKIEQYVVEWVLNDSRKFYFAKERIQTDLWPWKHTALNFLSGLPPTNYYVTKCKSKNFAIFKRSWDMISKY